MLWRRRPEPTAGSPNHVVPDHGALSGRRAGHAVDVLDGHRAGRLHPRVAPVRAAQELTLGRDDVAHRGPGRAGREADGAGRGRPCSAARRSPAAPMPRPTSALRRRSRRRLPVRGRCSSGRSRRRCRSRPPRRSGRSPGRKAGGRLPCCCQVWPKSGLWADQVEVPSLTMAVQSTRARRRSRSRTTSAFCGEATAVQVAPASLVVMTTPLPGQRCPVGADRHALGRPWDRTPRSARGCCRPTTCCAFHVMPPLVVAAITVAPVAGAGLGPATPTAQQRRAVAQDTAPRSPVPLGAGWPTASGVPVASPRTRARLGCTRVSGQRTARRGDGDGSENQEQAATASPDTPVAETRGVEARHEDNSGGGRISPCTVRYPRSGGLGRPADHRADAAGRRPRAAARGHRPDPHLRRLLPRLPSRDRRLGAPPAAGARRRHPLRPGRRRSSCSPPALLGYAGRVIGTWSNVTVRRHHLGNVDAVLGVGVAVVAVLLSVWVVAAVILSPNSRFTSLDAAVARSDILHSIDGVLPQAPSIFNDLQTFLNDQGFPQVFSTLTPPSTPVGLDADRMPRRRRSPIRPSSRRSRSSARRAAASRRARASWWARGWWPPTHTSWPGRATAARRSAREQRVQRDAGAVRSRLRPGGAADQRAARPRAHHQPDAGRPGHAGRAASAIPKTVGSPSGPPA